jgi:hypothetical protein
MFAAMNALLNRHTPPEPEFITRRAAGPPRRPQLALSKASAHAWKVHFVAHGDGITRCGLDVHDMRVQTESTPRLLRLRACRLCSAHVTAAAVRDINTRDLARHAGAPRL